MKTTISEAVRNIRFDIVPHPETRSYTKTGYLMVSQAIQIVDAPSKETDEIIRRGILKLLYGDVVSKLREIAASAGDWETRTDLLEFAASLDFK